MYIYVCIYLYTYMPTHTRSNTHTHIYIHIYVSTCNNRADWSTDPPENSQKLLALLNVLNFMTIERQNKIFEFTMKLSLICRGILVEILRSQLYRYFLREIWVACWLLRMYVHTCEWIHFRVYSYVRNNMYILSSYVYDMYSYVRNHMYMSSSTPNGSEWQEAETKQGDVQTHTHTCIHMYIFICIHIYAHVYINIYMCVCVCVCIYIYRSTSTHKWPIWQETKTQHGAAESGDTISHQPRLSMPDDHRSIVWARRHPRAINIISKTRDSKIVAWGEILESQHYI